MADGYRMSKDDNDNAYTEAMINEIAQRLYEQWCPAKYGPWVPAYKEEWIPIAFECAKLMRWAERAQIGGGFGPPPYMCHDLPPRDWKP